MTNLCISTVKITDISPLISGCPVGCRVGSLDALAQYMSLDQRDVSPANPTLFSGRLTLLNQQRVNQHISLCPSGSSKGQLCVVVGVCDSCQYNGKIKMMEPI